MSDQQIDLSAERVLVTGAGGVLGTALLSALDGRAGALRAPTRADCDLLDEAAVEAVWRDFAPTVVFHLAGRVTGVQGNISFGGQAFYENAKINLNVVEVSRRVGARKVVAAGTTAIYSDLVPIPMREDDLWLGAPHGSEGPYGHAKRAMLAQLEAYKGQYGLDFGYLICTNLYGPGDRFDEVYGHVVPSLVSRFHRAKRENLPSITIWGDGTPTRDFLFAGDAAEAFIRVAERGTGAFNTATGKSVPIRTLVETLAEVSGYEGEIVWDVTKPKGQLVRGYDVSRITALDWEARVSLGEGLKRTYDWYGANLGSVRV
ncbi:MAG: GDP-L-fucose synthase [Caulobacter sp.]